MGWMCTWTYARGCGDDGAWVVTPHLAGLGMARIRGWVTRGEGKVGICEFGTGGFELEMIDLRMAD